MQRKKLKKLTVEEVALKEIYSRVDEKKPEDLLRDLKQILDEDAAKPNPIYADLADHAEKVHEEGRKLLQDKEIKMTKDDKIKLNRSVAVVLNLLKTLETCTEHERKNYLQSPHLVLVKIFDKYPTYKMAISLLEKNAKDDAIGKKEFWTKFQGALLMLVGAAVTVLACVGLPITLGASIGLGAAGGLLFAGGATLFACGREASVAEKSSTLADQAKKLIY